MMCRRPRIARMLPVTVALAAIALPAAAQQPFTLRQVRSYPYPTDLVAAPTGARVAWVFDEQGVRNIYSASAPEWRAHRLSGYTEDDGQELTQLHFSANGNTVVYVRGGDHGSNWAGELQPDPMGTVHERKIQIFAVPFAGGEPRLLADGDGPTVSSRGVVAFERAGSLWTVPLDESAKPSRLFFDKGRSGDPRWSPDGSRLAFVSNRGDHALIGIYTEGQERLMYLDPSTGRDGMPRWSADGGRIAFVRRPGSGGAPRPWLEQTPNPWQIRVADARSGEGRQVWSSPNTLHGSYPTTQGRANLHWGAGDRIIFLADMDGWEHLYSVPVSGGEPALLTPHVGMAEYISISRDGRTLVWAGNMGDGPDDIERRHVFRVNVDGSGFENVTPGVDNEWTPMVTADGRWVAYLGGGAKAPPLPHAIPFEGGQAMAMGQDRIPSDFPTASLVVPTAVVFHAADGLAVHADLFEPPDGAGADLVRDGKRPAVIFLHGGPPRQMLLGWHYSYYYSNAYAVNQYLASRGYVVLAVNYRLGIGYGHDFHHPDHAGVRGASEYRDVEAGGRYLAELAGVDASRIGLWGGSYGGYLTALGLGRNSDLFAAGVDLHGVHDFTADGGRRFGSEAWRYEVSQQELQRRAEITWKSSPVAWVDSWRSPVLLIQGDDDRNVNFHQTVDLAQRLRARGVPFEEIVLPDEIHDFLRHASWLQADSATAEYFDRQFGGEGGGASAADARDPDAAELARWKREAADVTITRDDWGIAHVHGKTDADAVFGMEYAQAEDDFNRVETNYLNAMGRLAEAEGESQVWRDLRMKLFIDPDSAKAQYARSPEGMKRLMDAFADGLNYYLYTHPDVTPRVIDRFEPWMALTFTEGSIGGDIEVGVALRELAAFYGDETVGMAPPAWRGEPAGSNGIAIAPDNTLDGHALLYINPHTSFYFRSELQMSSDTGLDAYGAVTWGQFFIYQGFNRTAGWMHTSSGVDNIDQFLETVRERDGGWEYRYGSKWYPVRTRTITVPYRTRDGMTSRTFTAYYTRHGPVVARQGEKWITISLMQKPIESLIQDVTRTKVEDLAEFRTTMEHHTNSSNNTVFADAEGHIAFFHSNYIPRRSDAFDWTQPVDGSDTATAYHGVLSLDESPNTIDPAVGWVYNSNNWPWSAGGPDSPKRAEFPKYVERGTNETARGHHALRLLEGQPHRLGISSLTALAFDSYLPFFARTIPSLVEAYDALPAADSLRATLAAPITVLRGWDDRWEINSVATSLAVYWGTQLAPLMYRGAREAGVARSTYVAERVPAHRLLEALTAATGRLVDDFGDWRTPWGDINRFQRLDDSISSHFDDARPSIPVPFTSARWGSLASFGARPYPNTKKWYGSSGNSFIAAIEFGDRVRARGITAGGESGDPSSPHFDDEAARYATGNLRVIYFYPDQLEGHTERVYHPGE